MGKIREMGSPWAKFSLSSAKRWRGSLTRYGIY